MKQIETMTYHNAFENSRNNDSEEEETIVVDLMPPQYQMGSTPSPPSPPSMNVNVRRTPENINGKFHT